MEIILVLYLVGGLLLAGLSLPLILRKVKPNPWYGFRVAQTLEDPALWFEVNAYAGKRLLVAGLCSIAAALVFYAIPGLTVDSYALLCLAVDVLTLGIGITQSFLYLRKLTN